MRALTSAMLMGFLAACAPSLPDSGAGGVGFDNSLEAQRARDAALNTGANTGQPLVPASVLSDEATSGGLTSPQPAAQPTVLAGPAPPVVDNTGSAADIADQTAAALAAGSTGTPAPPLQAVPTTVEPNNVGISDENDFRAVSERETIESDAARIAQNRAQYQVIAPTALPTRTGGSQPNIVEFALSTSNPRGTSVYSRSSLNSAAKAARNCAKFASPDQAQTAFLSKGGPEKDRQGLDPDGDGYACSWDPAPFRQAANN